MLNGLNLDMYKQGCLIGKYKVNSVYLMNVEPINQFANECIDDVLNNRLSNQDLSKLSNYKKEDWVIYPIDLHTLVLYTSDFKNILNIDFDLENHSINKLMLSSFEEGFNNYIESKIDKCLTEIIMNNKLLSIIDGVNVKYRMVDDAFSGVNLRDDLSILKELSISYYGTFEKEYDIKDNFFDLHFLVKYNENGLTEINVSLR